MLLKKTKLLAAGKQMVGLLGAAMLLFAPLLSGCEKQAPSSSQPEVQTKESAQPPAESSAEPSVQPEAQAKENARERIENSIESALQYVRENPVDGWASTVSYPYRLFKFNSSSLSVVSFGMCVMNCLYLIRFISIASCV